MGSDCVHLTRYVSVHLLSCVAAYSALKEQINYMYVLFAGIGQT
jgi:hypothetical protein